MKPTARFYNWCSGILILASITLGVGRNSVFGVEPPVLLNAKTNGSVELDTTSGIYTYSYSFSNPITNTGQIWSIRIDMLKPQAGADVGRDGIEHERGSANIIESVVVEELAKQGKSLLPVGLYSPSKWRSGPSVFGNVGWGAMNDPYFIKPGQTLSGFRMVSRGLPGIRNIIIYPRMPYELWAREDDPPEEQTRKDDMIEEVAFKGQILGPTAPPAIFVALDFVSYIIDLKHQAGALGWITNPGVQDSLDVKLDQVKKKLQAGDTKTAANVLKAFLNEVDAQGCPKYDGCQPGKHLLPEAWALLKFNAEYLLGKL